MSSPERIQAACQAIAAHMGGTTFAELAQAVLDTVPEVAELDRLTKALHKLQVHPDWEYTTTVTQRKSGADDTPSGEGWVPNLDMFDGSYYERDDYTETNYFRRLIEHRRREELAERERGRAKARDFQSLSGLLRAWTEEANALVQRERASFEVGLGTHRLWHRIITNALGGPELTARLGPLFTLQLNAVFGITADELERHPEKQHDPVYQMLHELAGQLLAADSEIRSK